MTVKAAIDAGDIAALREVLVSNGGPNELVTWGPKDNLRTHPLHYVSDKVFDKTISEDRGVLLVDVLLESGANVNHRENETALLGAASLLAEDIGLRLLAAGADPNVLGSFGETALHWAAYTGLPRLAAGLLAAGARTDIVETRYNATPLGWAEHGLRTRPPGGAGQHEKVIALFGG
jgi:hypothetical protein